MKIFLSLTLWLILAATAQAGAVLETSAKLAPILKKASSVLLLDARSEKSRLQRPLEGAIPYQEKMAARPGLIVIIGENDPRALQVAQRLASTVNQTVYALKGGVAAWNEIKKQETPESLMPDSFVIPHNTCEQGSPLQEYKK